MSRKTAGLAGIGFALLIVSINLLLVPAGLPHTGAEPADVARFFTTERATVGLASALAPIAWVLATVFGAGVVSVLWRSGDVAWPLVGFAGVLLQNLAFTGVMAVRLALASGSGGLWALHDALFVFNGAFLALALTGFSIGGRRAGLIGRWPAATGLLAAALQLASAVLSPLVIDDPGPVGLLGLTGWLLWVGWIIWYAVSLLRAAPHGHGVAAAAGRADASRAY